jgi:hypothetical protein
VLNELSIAVAEGYLDGSLTYEFWRHLAARPS